MLKTSAIKTSYESGDTRFQTNQQQIKVRYAFSHNEDTHKYV